MSLTRQCTIGAPARTRVTFLSRQESNQRNAAPRPSARHKVRDGQPRDFGCLNGPADGTSLCRRRTPGSMPGPLTGPRFGCPRSRLGPKG